MFLRIYH